tara:strand:+ start:64 stop:1050 length:987 start_codon:yes stop_codon:yes gene_type:complete
MANTKTKVTIEGVVEETLTLDEIANLIKADEWKETTDIELLNFYTINDNGERKPDPSKRFQVRGFYLNKEFVNEKVEYVRSTGDRDEIDMPTVVRMPDGTYKLDDGSHTIDIILDLGGVLSIEAYVVDYEKHLGGKDSNALGLGNLLNIKTKEKQTATSDNIKSHFLQILAEKKAAGLSTKMTDEEKDEFVGWYQGKVTTHTLGQWYSRTPDGGRHSIAREYSEQEKLEKQQHYSDDPDYEDYYVTFPKELSHASTSILGQSLVELAKTDKEKVLILLYCRDNADVARINGVDGKGESTWKTNLDQNYSSVSKLTDLTIKYKVLNWKN